ncbi:MAG TPA: helix-turn-helix domain-containing protein [Candidatus Blautia merdavium]|uniref:Helix-turn-helix domain-containing protein n=1 Tax=Candidatus Blautia merdavium TaxID=2838494 RepID=A0A9D2PLS0_9FIRM|nr:helix-turn-helix domain-containing protein [Candidatus Blautia merdavium]
MDYSGLGKRIRTIRISRKMTQQMLGEETDYSVQHISHVETGKTKLSVECLFDIANALNVSLDELACGYVNSASVVLDSELKAILDDCTPQEKEVILDTVKTLKRSLKKNSSRSL